MQSIIKFTAADFLKTMKEEGFESFQEMKNCYKWTANDIKEELAAIFEEYEEETGKEAWVDEEDEETICSATEQMPYKDFIKEVKEIINKSI